MREVLISELAKDLLGPRRGPDETLDINPLHEYLTGVLAPKKPLRTRDPEAEGELAGEALPETIGEDTVDEVDFPAPMPSSPVLDPRALPHSIGISFVAEGTADAVRMQICCTWGRYLRQGKGGWKRQPRHFVSDVIEIGSDSRPRVIRFRGDGAVVGDGSEAEAALHIRGTKIGPNTFHVAVYLVNEVPVRGSGPTAEHHLFQPQIRIACQAGTGLVPYRLSPLRPGSEPMEFLYREKPVLGRGHMCSAIWREIDPEASALRRKAHETGASDPLWPDGGAIDPEIRNRFSPPDVRTEFLPMVSTGFPDLSWDERWGSAPVLDAEALSEVWHPDDLERALRPLADGYRRWIDRLRETARISTSDSREIADRLLDSCEEAHGRMLQGIELLKSDENARLAFCFMNKAISLQAAWAGRPKFVWRPFQLAFILATLESAIRPNSRHRGTCDLLWVPTGAGKTEAYLGLAALVLAYRRRRALSGREENPTGGGVAVLTRYTLRLLTIQQFRRILRLITACEFLRVHGLREGSPVGWRPKAFPGRVDFLWGSLRFSVGLWVGGQVTPNRLTSTWGNGRIEGAIEILRGRKGEGEPAQVLNCPACDAILSIPEKGLPRGKLHAVHLVVALRRGRREDLESLLSDLQAFQAAGVTVQEMSLSPCGLPEYLTLSIRVRSDKDLTAEKLEGCWRSLTDEFLRRGIELELQAARASRPGYFIVWYVTQKGTFKPRNFELLCPNPSCPLNVGVAWVEGAPTDCGWLDMVRSRPELEEHRKRFRNLFAAAKYRTLEWKGRKMTLPDGMFFRMPPAEFCRDIDVGKGVGEGEKVTWPYLSTRIPIPALTVDEQIYHHPPSVVVATVDKFARLPFEPRCAGLFGNVDFYHARFGYYRQWAAPYIENADANGHPPGAGGGRPLHVDVRPFMPVELIIQDELHLIEGPLGSLVGLAETAIGFLIGERGNPPKYVASTATASRAENQVLSLFDREVRLFPPLGLEAGDRFFLRISPADPFDDSKPGRLYMGVLAPGKGPLTPVYRIWSRLLQASRDIARGGGREADPYWTLVGYFNSIRELAGARALYRQDVPARLKTTPEPDRREIPEDRALELSSRTRSTDLPSVLNALGTEFSGNPSDPSALDALFTTSMFGTGVDVPRLSLMVVHGQPKTTSAYIQSTGRVGRKRGALVVTFYRATRPRDLSHYEMFAGYHLALDRFVEPVTVAPYSPGALDRLGGPLMVGILRNSRGTPRYAREDGATLIAQEPCWTEALKLSDYLESRAGQQPAGQKPEDGWVKATAGSQLDRWRTVAARHGDLRYAEYGETRNPVVLGDPPHQYSGRPVVYRNAPQSLREVEETTGLET